jgi:hypothetical protein
MCTRCEYEYVNLDSSGFGTNVAPYYRRLLALGGGGRKGSAPPPTPVTLESEVPSKLEELDSLLRPGIEIENVWPSFKE